MTRRSRLAVVLGSGAGAVVLAPHAAHAHGIVQRTSLPVPEVVFAWAAAIVLELSATRARLRRREPGAAEAMTAQEHQIARLVAGGTSNKGIAAQLFLSPKTVEAHLTRIYRKLGVHSRTQLAAQLDRPGAGSGDHAGSPST